MNTYIIGHINPDTDSVVSAIAYSYLKEQLGEENFPALSDPINKETKYILEKFGFGVPALISEKEKKVVLVDHNDPSQISPKVKLEEIVEIIDHHNLGGLSLGKTIPVKIETVGCTATILTKIFTEKNVQIPANIASILVAGIISDTLKFTSPTTTDEDEKTLGYLNVISQLDIDSLAEEMFRAKSDLTGISTEEILNTDYKEYNLKGKKIGIGVFETVDPAPLLEKITEIKKELDNKKSESNLDNILFAAIDITKQKAFFITSSEDDEALVKKAFKSMEEKDYLLVGSIVSRKKQIVPEIEKAI